ncbi:aminotransferase class I/II-fold pyridoxal phosphate-dependent enzyme [Simplicispira psychrophila]|uniref:aminotransferase class I/II-fold pyridoxal phosphate-dependent enzyme n=1 Tax=Simplicispira psychrophila TaxID=80882 RepID=UPI000690D36E|nr:aminotransferase class I/II-fold pyridoxal phosphate-dependent enzyme [Simplicispira psychrophila]
MVNKPGVSLAPVSAGPVHGGPDARGPVQYDFSTNSNACGPCPSTLAEVQQADATRYPDPAYTVLRARLAAFHGVAPERIVLAASASEFIHRITALAAQQGARAVALPAYSYGDYAQAAQARGLQVLRPPETGWSAARLHWACEPSSPLGGVDPAWAAWRSALQLPDAAPPWCVLDCAYRPLRLHTDRALDLPDIGATAWQLWTPNKALGLTGVRAAYAIGPPGAEAAVAALIALAPSWPVGAHGVALLESWVTFGTQRWLAECLPVLRDWKAQQQALCTHLGWTVLPGSQANYFCAHLQLPDLQSGLLQLRTHGIQLRDCTSFGLPGVVRLGVLPPAAQAALRRAWRLL